VDPFTLGEVAKEIFSSPLVWAGAGPASLESEYVNRVADASTPAGFEVFKVVFHGSVIPSFVGPKMLSLDPFYDSSPKFKKPSTPTLGLSIEPLITPQWKGVGALLTHESKESDLVFLACTHPSPPPSLQYGPCLQSHGLSPTSTLSLSATLAAPAPWRA
jgi:hypothetical protein